jgi:hypothetical protein
MNDRLPDWARGPGAWALEVDPSLEELDDLGDPSQDPVEVGETNEAVATALELDAEVRLLPGAFDADLKVRGHSARQFAGVGFKEELAVLYWLGRIETDAYVVPSSPAVGSADRDASHGDERGVEVSVLLAVADLLEDGEWVVWSRLHPPLVGLEVVDVPLVARGDPFEHSFAVRLPAALSVLRLVQEDRELTTTPLIERFLGIDAVVDSQLGDQVVEGGSGGGRDLARVDAPVGVWRIVDPEYNAMARRRGLDHAPEWTSSFVIRHRFLKRVELLLCPRQLRSTTGKVSLSHGGDDD